MTHLHNRIQDLEEPPDQWIEQKDRSGKKFYTNPATGLILYCTQNVCMSRGGRLLRGGAGSAQATTALI